MSPNPKHTRAFTLIEVIVALAVTVIVLGGIFGVAGATMDLATMSNRLRIDEMRHDQLSRFLRTSLLQLPPRSEVTLKNGEELTILDAGGTFQWPGSISQGARTDFRFANHTFEIVHFLGDAEISTLALIENVTFLAIEIHDPNTRLWTRNVPANAPVRPSLVKIRYQLERDMRERIEVFRIPRFAQVNFTPQRISQNDEPPSQ
jgi:prepilin-type N-terminal cleavage/methylation domain-containing protein